ncbi:MAG: hypothetical protein IJY09_11710 [Lachnospiraceae bacterium]|nr:hypothetical protein [Lachnospiraceae bacterium]
MEEKYEHLDITIKLDIPAGGNYDLVLYDKQGKQVGVVWNNKNDGRNVTFSLSTQQENVFYIIYPQLAEMQSYGWAWRERLQEGQEKPVERVTGKSSPEKSAASYNEQLEQAWLIEEKRQWEYEQEA